VLKETEHKASIRLKEIREEIRAHSDDKPEKPVFLDLFEEWLDDMGLQKLADPYPDRGNRP
jgi:hypothetical protein